MRKILLIGVPLTVAIALLFTNAPYQWLTQRSIESALIKDKQVTTASVKQTGKVKSSYMIYTDHGVFRNDDAGWFLKYDSSDVYGDLDVGKTYRLKVYGWRIPILSMYPNIVHAEGIKTMAPATVK